MGVVEAGLVLRCAVTADVVGVYESVNRRVQAAPHQDRQTRTLLQLKHLPREEELEYT